MRLFIPILLALAFSSCGSTNLNDLELQEEKEQSSSSPSTASGSHATHTNAEDHIGPHDTCYIFEDKHIAIFYDRISDTQVDVTLLSLQQWTDTPSANSKTSPNTCQNLKSRYLEYDHNNWSIPTAEQAKRIKTAFGDNPDRLSRLNALMYTLDAHPLYADNQSRYLCDEGKKSFSLAPNTNISSAGTTSNNYILRLLKTITITVPR